MSAKSKSNRVHEEQHPLRPSAALATASALARETTAAVQASPASRQKQRTEEMYELADIFAAIFEALPEGHEHAIVTASEAA
jgi:hypothetical protein